MSQNRETLLPSFVETISPNISLHHDPCLHCPLSISVNDEGNSFKPKEATQGEKIYDDHTDNEESFLGKMKRKLFG